MPIVFRTTPTGIQQGPYSQLIVSPITNLYATSTVAGQIVLSWSGGAGYNVQYSYAVSAGTIQSTSGINPTTITLSSTSQITTNVTLNETVLGGSTSAVSNSVTTYTVNNFSSTIIILGSNQSWISTNGTTYTNYTTTGTSNGAGDCFQSAFNRSNNKYYFGSYGTSKIFYTSDGINFSTTSNFTQPSISAICYANNMLVACGNQSGTNNRNTMYCTDGINWNYGTTLTASANSMVTSIAYSTVLNIWVSTTISTSNTIWWSTDGINWTAGTISGYSGSYGPIGVNDTGSGLFILAGANSSNNFFYSTDGKTWTARSSSPFGASGANSVYYSPTKNLWLATSAGGIATSADSITWTKTSTTPTDATTAQYIPSISLWVTSNGSQLVYFSSDTINWTQVTYGPQVSRLYSGMNDRTSFS